MGGMGHNGRSKGVSLAFKKAGVARNMAQQKKTRTAAYHAKEAFMKEAMARHLAAAESAAAAAAAAPDNDAPNAPQPAGQPSSTPDAGARTSAVAAPEVKARAVKEASVTYSKRTSAVDIEAKRLAKKVHVAKLKSKMGTGKGEILVGQLKFEGKGAARKVGNVVAGGGGAGGAFGDASQSEQTSCR